MNRLVAAVAVALALAPALPAAAQSFVQDQAGMFSARTVAQLNQRIGNFNAQTGKEIVVMTVPSLGGTAIRTAAQAAFAQQGINGILIFIARDDRQDIIVPGTAEVRSGWFAGGVLGNVRSGMEQAFKAENYDAGITGAVAGLLDIYRQHLASLNAARGGGTALAPQAQAPLAAQGGGFHLGIFWWIVLIVVGFLIVRSLMRTAAMARTSGVGAPGAPPGTAGTPPPGAPGYGPGYGPGYYGGGGGSFWSGLLGGLGGAWLGNEMFGNRGGGQMIDPGAGGALGGGTAGGWGANAGGDAGGWANDAGAAGMGGASSGDWSGGGFGDAGGGGFGGSGFGGGGDFGGGGGDFGGGDSGGGW